ncbi:VQ motif-containing protein 8, chloroplastic-like [Malania oleifera]|uniref:VQ motif-containing protein 8, chloroplastic-like n=1 Tax=Malania oleifera TaxID=397392 RepID=UPI0025AE3D5E|nr:VQ motif-containing protein 8, chloroplastic-like [Malania oleifera]
MSPAKFRDHHGHASKETINGPRPSPLKINNGSRFTHKTSYSSSSSVSSALSSVAEAASDAPAAAGHKHRNPVIIYTHSPKIIHTQARDFMALVQRLTGPSRSERKTKTTAQNNALQALAPTPEQKIAAGIPVDENESSSVLTDESSGGIVGDAAQVTSPSSASLIFNLPANPFIADMPLFTPTSPEFFRSSQPLYRYSDPVMPPASMSSSMATPVWEIMKGFPEC